jgi:hypothetical protein
MGKEISTPYSTGSSGVFGVPASVEELVEAAGVSSWSSGTVVLQKAPETVGTIANRHNFTTLATNIIDV